MLCPQCGYDIGNKHKCIRCGYEVKELSSVVREEKKKEDEPEVHVIDPRNTYISSGFEDDFADPFSMLFGDIFDPIGSLLGDLFGINMRSPFSSHFISEQPEPEPEPKKKKSNKVVEVNTVEVLDENGKPVKGKDKKDKKKGRK